VNLLRKNLLFLVKDDFLIFSFIYIYLYMFSFNYSEFLVYLNLVVIKYGPLWSFLVYIILICLKCIKPNNISNNSK
jgi:hypothetical protein